jgi:hypothetical protein
MKYLLKGHDLVVYQCFSHDFKHNVLIEPSLLPSTIPFLKSAEGPLTFVHRSFLAFSALQLFWILRLANLTFLRVL